LIFARLGQGAREQKARQPLEVRFGHSGYAEMFDQLWGKTKK